MLGKFKIGCDPELFIQKKDTHELVPAPLLGIPGTKDEPFPLKDGIFVQVDGLALEFNIPPAETFEQFNTSVESALAQLQALLPDDCEFLIVPTVEFPKDMYEALPDEAKELGCDPDFDAWLDGKENARPDNATGLRSAAGHLHIGWTDDPVDPKHPEHLDICCSIVRHLDHYLGLALSLVDKDYRRSKLYGKPGAFRPKPYGVEYRVPSNWWVGSADRRKFIWQALEIALNAAVDGNMRSEKSARTILLDPEVHAKTGKASNAYHYTPESIRTLIPFEVKRKAPVPSTFVATGGYTTTSTTFGTV